MKSVYLFLFLLIMAVSCSTIMPPKMYITGDKSVVESQVVGDYKEIESDAWAISSAQTHVQRERSTNRSAIGDVEIFKAMKVRDYHLDKIREYKNEGVLGEAQDGYIVYRPGDEYESDRDLKKILNILINEENKARKTIFKRTLILGGKSNPTPYDIRLFGEKFAEEQQELALEGDLVQNKSGNWFRKK